MRPKDARSRDDGPTTISLLSPNAALLLSCRATRHPAGRSFVRLTLVSLRSSDIQPRAAAQEPGTSCMKVESLWHFFQPRQNTAISARSPRNAANTILPAAAGSTASVWTVIERTPARPRTSGAKMLDIVARVIVRHKASTTVSVA